MSKKHKIKRKIVSPVPERSSESKPAHVHGPANLLTAGTLILFERKTKIFLFILLAAYLILSSLKIHTSNIANWDIFFGLEKSESVIAGKPRFIRMDEWMITSSAVIGQYEAGLPIKNEANGGGNSPVVFGLPIKDISSILRPSVWPYFIFDVETAFAFSWNFNILFFLVSMFFLFMLLTKNNFWLSLFGTFFIFLAPGIQWWSYTVSTFMTYLNGMVIAFIYLLYSKKTLSLLISSLILIICIFSFFAFLYPAFQVPLIYLYFTILVGYLFREKKFALVKDRWKVKSLILSAALILLGIILFHYYQIARDTFSMMLNTVYPGRRFSMGGNLRNGKVFADFFSMFMSDDHTPTQWQNICEASGALMFFPIVFYSLFFYYFKYKKTDSLLLSMSAFVIFTLIYVLAGFPAFLSKITLLSMSPDFRTLPIIGIGNCILLICYIGSKKIEIKKNSFSWIEFSILTAAVFIFMMIVSSHINKSTDNFFTSTQVAIATLLVTISYLLTRFKDFRIAKPALYIVLSIMVISEASVNPLTKGLSPVLENPLTQAAKEIRKKDPEAGWALFGNNRLANLVKAAGGNILNGVKYVPPLEQMHVLDPRRKNDSIYNRYAWITMGMYIDGKDSIIFRQTFNDGYTIFMDPCSPRLKQLKVKYFVFDYKPKDVEIRCMTKQIETANLFIYKRNDQ